MKDGDGAEKHLELNNSVEESSVVGPRYEPPVSANRQKDGERGEEEEPCSGQTTCHQL